jgi:tRNA-dihydrouridine synthase
MRVVARRFGAEFATAEVMLDELVIREGKHRVRLLKIGSDDHPLGGQLLGSRPEQFGEAASDLVEAGYDLVDINLGCPVKKVLGRCRGGFLLSEPESALAIVKAVIQAVGGRRPVMVKMRRGSTTLWRVSGTSSRSSTARSSSAPRRLPSMGAQ